MASAAGRRRTPMSVRTSMAAAARAAGIMGDYLGRGNLVPHCGAAGCNLPVFATDKISPAAPIGPDVARVDDPAIHTGELDTLARFGIEVDSGDCSAGHRGADVPIPARRHRAQGLDGSHAANVGNSNRRDSLGSPM